MNSKQNHINWKISVNWQFKNIKVLCNPNFGLIGEKVKAIFPKAL